MATQTLKVSVQIDDKVIELKGAEKEAFLADREELQKQEEIKQTKLAAQKQLKISAYTKLGLTTEEINAIL